MKAEKPQITRRFMAYCLIVAMAFYSGCCFMARYYENTLERLLMEHYGK